MWQQQLGQTTTTTTTTTTGSTMPRVMMVMMMMMMMIVVGVIVLVEIVTVTTTTTVSSFVLPVHLSHHHHRSSFIDKLVMNKSHFSTPRIVYLATMTTSTSSSSRLFATVINNSTITVDKAFESNNQRQGQVSQQVSWKEPSLSRDKNSKRSLKVASSLSSSFSSQNIMMVKPSRFPKRKAKQPPSSPLPDQEYQWLTWLYHQWKDTIPGQLIKNDPTTGIVKQMIVAIPCWARRRSLAAAQRAEQLLDRLLQEASWLANNDSNQHPSTSNISYNISSNMACSPLLQITVSEFNAVMDAYAKIGNPQGVQRILRRMESLTHNNTNKSHHHNHPTVLPPLRPDAFSMSILATAWAKSRTKDAAQNAEAILSYMDSNGIVPNTVTYNAVLSAIAAGNQLDKAIKAEGIVRQMKQRQELGQQQQQQQDCAPDIYTYQSLIQAWSRTSFSGAPQKAEQILQYLEEVSQQQQNEHLEPNVYCYTCKFGRGMGSLLLLMLLLISVSIPACHDHLSHAKEPLIFCFVTVLFFFFFHLPLSRHTCMGSIIRKE
jgi:hypothetical protein